MYVLKSKSYVFHTICGISGRGNQYMKETLYAHSIQYTFMSNFGFLAETSW